MSEERTEANETRAREQARAVQARLAAARVTAGDHALAAGQTGDHPFGLPAIDTLSSPEPAASHFAHAVALPQRHRFDRYGDQIEEGAGEANKTATIEALQAQIASPSTDGDTRVRLVVLLGRLRVSKGRDAAAAIAEARGVLASAGGGADADAHTQLMGRLAAVDKLIDTTFKEHEQYLTDEERKRMAILTAERDKYAPGSPEWLALERQRLAAAAQTASDASQRAPEGSKAHSDLQHVVRAAQQSLKELFTHNAREHSHPAATASSPQPEKPADQEAITTAGNGHADQKSASAAPPRIVVASLDASNDALPNMKPPSEGRALVD